MTQRETGTEQLIKNTAKHLFFAEGKLHATTQEIADAAGVNRTLVNYYFRSRDALFDQVFQEAQQELVNLLDEVYESKKPFRDKIRNMIDVFMEAAIKYPYREVFIITQMNRNDVLDSKRSRVEKVNLMLQDVQAEMDRGGLKKNNPKHFLMNLFSMMAYPMVTSPLNKVLFNMTDDEYDVLIKERKQIIFETIFP